MLVVEGGEEGDGDGERKRGLTSLVEADVIVETGGGGGGGDGMDR